MLLGDKVFFQIVFKDCSTFKRTTRNKWILQLWGNSSIVSGGYEDDFDSVDEIIYTVARGNDSNSDKEITKPHLEKHFYIATMII